jgi:16S rRNA (guanosine(1370)-2'-O)-methyltransferase
MPRTDTCSFKQRISLPITVVCDNVRDPGNMGTIIRTCAAAGCDRLLTLKGCVDIWDPKVIRSGMGAHFRLPITPDIGWETLADHRHTFEETTKSNNNGTNRIECTTNWNKIHVDHRLFSFFSESKQMFEDMLENRKKLNMKSNQTDDQSFSLSKNRFLPLYKNIPIDHQSLWKAFVNVKSSNHTTIIVGGETEGISLQARKLTIEYGGKMVYIPLLNDVDSLNVSIALSIILMELRKSYEDLVEKFYAIEPKDV